jgi:hypothetical protein
MKPLYFAVGGKLGGSRYLVYIVGHDTMPLSMHV